MLVFWGGRIMLNNNIAIHSPERGDRVMTQSTTDRSFILVFRLLMAWTFLYAASHQVFNPKFSAAAFLSHTKTFHDVYAVLATPAS